MNGKHHGPSGDPGDGPSFDWDRAEADIAAAVHLGKQRGPADTEADSDADTDPDTVTDAESVESGRLPLPREASLWPDTAVVSCCYPMVMTSPPFSAVISPETVVG